MIMSLRSTHKGLPTKSMPQKGRGFELTCDPEKWFSSLWSHIYNKSDSYLFNET